jgi:multiple sugar transport system permease protein
MGKRISQEGGFLAALVLLVIGVFYAIPLFQIFFESLYRNTGLASSNRGEFVGWSNYVASWQDPSVLQAAVATLAFTLPSVAAQVCFAFAAAIVTRKKYPAVNLLRAMFIAPYFLPSVVVVVAWKFFADPFDGLLPPFFRAAGLAPPDLQGPSAALPTMILVATYEAFPFTYVVLLARMMQIPRSLYEMAELDGASPWLRFWAVTWPQIRLTLAGLLVLRFLITWLKFDVPWLVYAYKAQSPWADTLGVEIYRLAFRHLQRGNAYALSMTLIFMAWALYGLSVILIGRKDSAVSLYARAFLGRR